MTQCTAGCRVMSNGVRKLGGTHTEGVPLAIRVFTSKPDVVQHHLPAVDVVTKTPTSQTQTILTVSLANSFKLLHVMLFAAVVRILLKDGKGGRKNRGEVLMFLDEGFE